MIKAADPFIIIKPEYEEKIGSIIIPETNESRKRYSGYSGEVIAVCDKCKLDVKVGDKITYRRHEGFKVKYKGKEYIAINSERWLEAKYV